MEGCKIITVSVGDNKDPRKIQFLQFSDRALIPNGNLRERPHWRVPQNCVTKTEMFWGLVPHIYIVFLNPLLIYVPDVEIIFCINHYFLVCIFNYRISSRKFDWYCYFNSGLDIYWYFYFYTIIHSRSNRTKTRTSAKTTTLDRCVWCPNFVFTTSASSVVLFCINSSNLLFYCCLDLIPVFLLWLSTEVAKISEHSSSNNIIG